MNPKKGFVFDTEKDLSKALDFFNYAYLLLMENWGIEIKFYPSNWKGKKRKLNVERVIPVIE